MEKINFNSIKSKMILGYGTMALLIVVVTFITLSQISNIIALGNEVLEKKQPSRIYINAFKSGIHRSNVVVQNYLLSGDNSLKNELDGIWKNEILPVKDSLDAFEPFWNNPEDVIIHEKLNRLAERINSKQQEVLEEASFGGGVVSVSIGDYSNLLGDTIYDIDDLQVWIDDELGNQTQQDNPNANLYTENLKPLSTEFEQLASQLYSHLKKESRAVGDQVFVYRDRFIIVEFIIVLVSILVCFLLYRFARKQIESSITSLQKQIKILSEGNIPDTKIQTNDEFDIILGEIHLLAGNLANVKDFALEVGKGNFDSNIAVFNNEGQVGSSLAEMRDSLKNVSEETRIRNWANKGSAEFGDILRKFNSNIAELSEQVITFMVNYLKANQGSIFIVEENERKGEAVLRLTATYAYDRKKYLEKTILPGQGLVGQVYLEKESIYLKELPQNYVTITSGLGQATPNSIFIVPLIANETVYGVIELGTFTELTVNERAFLEEVGENIASSIQSVKINERTNKLLEESQDMTEQMRSQEEEVRQNMEELQATQEEMERSQRENNERLAAIEKSGLAYVEFSPEGEIITADGTFVNLFGYESSNELKGQFHEIFVSAEYAKSSEYQQFWEELRAGKIKSGIFERYGKQGQRINIKGTYAVLRNHNNQVTKIVEFAFDITDLSQQLESVMEEKEVLMKQLEEVDNKIEDTEEGSLEELKKYQRELKKSLLEKLKKNEDALRASLDKQKKNLGLS